MPDFSFRMDGRGKVRPYQKDGYYSAYQNKGRYLNMDQGDFVAWKNAGKRTASNKVTDPKTAKNYAYHGGEFYEFDKTKPNNLGRALKNNTWSTPLGSWKGENDSMKARLANGELLDRRRVDRTSLASPLQPLDVGTYASSVTIGHSYFPELPKAKGVWAANNDHIASGESIRQRNGVNHQVAYDEGLAIAIDNPRMHASAEANHFPSFSPTYGTRQTKLDTEPNGTTRSRIDGDVALPARAFYRDAMMQIEGAQGQNYSAFDHQPRLDFTQKANKLSLTGAYRFMFKSSGKFNQNLGAGRGFNPDDPGHEFQELPGRAFKYSAPATPQTQGNMFVTRLAANMKTLALAT